MAQQNVHYFPGHMNKAVKQIANYVKIVDMVIEILDSRAPLSSRNPLLDSLINGKKRLIVLSKTDYADPEATKSWKDYFKKQGIPCVDANLRKSGLLSLLSSSCKEILSTKRAKEAKIGMKPQPIKAMVVGIPNVGKSTLINNLKGHKSAPVGNKAGITKSEQWIKLSGDFILLDTPGILPMNYPDGAMAVRLAILGSMREDVLPTEDLSYALLGYLRETYPDALNERFGIEDLDQISSRDCLISIASKRGLLLNGLPSEEKAAYLLIKEFKDGMLGHYSLEVPDNA